MTESRIHQPQRRSRRRRSGLTVLELVVTLVLLGTVATCAIPPLRAVQLQRREHDRRELALQEAANLLERFTVRGWEAVDPSAAAELTLSEEAAARLPEALLQVTVSSSDATTDTEPSRKAITVELSWKNAAGQQVQPVRLTTFLFRKGDAL